MEATTKTFTMPAEWEPHSAIWLSWPHDEIGFPNLEKVKQDIANIIKGIHASEKVKLLVLNDQMQNEAQKALSEAKIDLARITFHQIEYVGGWMRDCGGIFVRDAEGKLNLLNWKFNSWGGKFDDLMVDAGIPTKVAEWTGLNLVSPGIVLEGGAIEVNGQGVLVTTEQCLLNPNRNPELTKEDYEKYFKEYLGVTKTIWLKKGLFNDHTDGHIDDVAKFISPTKILCCYEDNSSDENYVALKENYDSLVASTDTSGNPLEVIKLPMPHMNYADDKPFEAGLKAPVSYANFYIGNTVVLLPSFNDPNDSKALEIVQQCFPNKKVVQIDCRDLVYGGGAIHCLTQQQPV